MSAASFVGSEPTRYVRQALGFSCLNTKERSFTFMMCGGVVLGH